MVEDMYSVHVQGVGWAKESNHVEESKLVFMDKSRSGEGSRQEVQSWGRSARVEAL